jgi:hypothetical protein
MELHALDFQRAMAHAHDLASGVRAVTSRSAGKVSGLAISEW